MIMESLLYRPNLKLVFYDITHTTGHPRDKITPLSQPAQFSQLVLTAQSHPDRAQFQQASLQPQPAFAHCASLLALHGLRSPIWGRIVELVWNYVEPVYPALPTVSYTSKIVKSKRTRLIYYYVTAN